MNKLPSIGRAELDLLRYISDHQPVSIRTAADHMAEAKGHARTTVLSMMQRLHSKGYLRRSKVDGIYQYEAKVPKQDLLKRLVGQFIDQALGGSVSPFMAFLAEDARLSRKEKEELKKLVRQLERKS